MTIEVTGISEALIWASSNDFHESIAGTGRSAHKETKKKQKKIIKQGNKKKSDNTK